MGSLLRSQAAENGSIRDQILYSIDASFATVTPPAGLVHEGDVDVDFHVRFFDSALDPRLEQHVRPTRQGGGARSGEEIRFHRACPSTAVSRHASAGASSANRLR